MAMGLIAWIRRTPERAIATFAIGLVLAAVIYIGFALFWGDLPWLGIEVAGLLFYSFLAYLGFKKDTVWLVIGWFLHVGWDLALHMLGPGEHIVPAWYAITCLSFDVVIALYIFIQMQNSTSTSISHETLR